MKKILCLILVIVLGLSFSGCFKLKKAEPTVIEGTNKAAELTNFKVTALEISEAENSFFAEEGTVVVAVKFEVMNTSSASKYFYFSMFEPYCDDIKVSTANIAEFEMIDSGDIAPGKKIVGYYPIEVPSDWEQIEILFKNGISSSNAAATFIFENK